MVFSSLFYYVFLTRLHIFKVPICFWRLQQENKEYKDFKNKDFREIYSYKVLFGDAFDSKKYAVTPTKLCRTRFVMFEDNGYKDTSDSTPTRRRAMG